MPFATPFREIVSNLFFDRNGCLIPVLKFRDEYYYAKDKYRGLFILLPPSMKSRDTRWFMYTADKQKRTIFFFFTQCFNITCDGEKLFTYLLTKIEREVHRGDKRFIHQLKFLFYGNVFFTPVSPCVNLFGKNLGYFERYFTNFLSIVEEDFWKKKLLRLFTNYWRTGKARRKEFN